MLSGLSGLAVSTVRGAIDELERGGYPTSQKIYRYNIARAHPVFDRTVYQIHKYLLGGFTLVPADVLQNKALDGSAFILALYLCQQGAGQGRAFPSIRQIVDAIGLEKSTVCRALRQIKAISAFLVRHCVRSNRAHAANSYFFLHKIVCKLGQQTARPALLPYINCTAIVSLMG